MYVPALKQTQAVDPQIKAETEAEASTDKPEPVSIEAVRSRCEGVCTSSSPKAAFGFGKRFKAFCFTGADLTVFLFLFWAEFVVSPVPTALNAAVSFSKKP